MHRIARRAITSALIGLVAAACSDSPEPSTLLAPGLPATSASAAENARHLVVFHGDNAPADFGARVVARGGSVERVFVGAGLAIIRGLADEAATDLAATPDIAAVDRDITIGPPDAEESATAEAAAAEAAVASEPSPGPCGPPAAAGYYRQQWNLRESIGADVAWDNGYLGSALVSVFLLDTGIDYTHPDLRGRVRLDRSVSLLNDFEKPGPDVIDERAKDPVMDYHSHGTSVASVIVSNACHLAGVTQNTTIVSVKVHGRQRQGEISVYVAGIIYAAEQGADVIHLSIPASFDKRERPGAVAAINKATSYAHQKGAVLVAAAGNAMAGQAPTDFDRDQDGFKFCNAAHVICVSATAPTSAQGLNGPWANVDAVAPYTFYGRSTISVAGPGGIGARGAPTSVWLACSRSSLVTDAAVRRCSVGDPIWSSTGTSFGAAATSGLAALLVDRLGKGRPAEIRATIEKSADDRGDPGVDPYYGRGRINVARAVGLSM